MDSINDWEAVGRFKGISHEADMSTVIIQFEEASFRFPVGDFLEFPRVCSALSRELVNILLARQNEAEDIVSGLEDYLRQERAEE